MPRKPTPWDLVDNKVLKAVNTHGGQVAVAVAARRTGLSPEVAAAALERLKDKDKVDRYRYADGDYYARKD